jgi:RNA polymerase sigma factor (sigma-70 family)
MSKLHLFPRLQADHEDLFLARYERLLAFARQLRDVDAQRAADLVHDAFVQFIVSRPPLDNIENLDGYLQRMVRNLQLSEIRRRAPVQSLLPEAAEPETAALQLQALKDHASLAAVKAELCAMCRYAIARKESSRAGSAFILRFFHGYYIHEIAQILRTEKQTVYDLLRIARREARACRESGDQLSFIGNVAEDITEPLLTETSDEGELVERLREAIFNSCRTDCLPVRQLRQRYREESKESIDTALAAHLVSCRRCLEVVNRALGLRALEDRFPTDTLGPGASAGETKQPLSFKRKPAKGDWRSECRARADEIYHHEPEELLVSVNGFVIVRQTISGGVSEQTTSINLSEPIGFVEIFCEHGLRLAFFNVEPPTAGVREQQWQQWQIALSGGRTLELSLNFEHPWPQLHVGYQTLTEYGVRNAERGMEVRRALPSLLFPMDDAALSVSPGFLARIYSALRNPQSAIKLLLRPITITVLLAILLITVVVGQKLGWWFAPSPPAPNPTTAPTRRAFPADKAPSGNVPTVEPPAGKATAAPALTPTAAPVLATATAALEIEVLRLLNAARADLNEQIEVKRTPQGRLRIEAILDTEARKAEVLTALAEVRGNPALEMDLQTVAEAVARRQRGNPPAATSGTMIEREEIAQTSLAVEAELRRHFSGRGLSDAALQAEMRRFASAARANSFKARSHATALKQLAARFSTEELRGLDEATRSQWLGLLRGHARQTRDAMLALRAQIAPVFAASSNDSAEAAPLNNDEELRRACDRLAVLCAESDRVIHAAFTILADASPAAALRTLGFWQRLHRIEHLAEAISILK